MLLMLKLNTLKDYVDLFVITEANMTHSGLPKKLNFDMTLFKEFEHQIRYVVWGGAKVGIDPWKNEHAQRNYKFHSLVEELEDHDIVIIDDCDEIISPEALNAFKVSGAPAAKLD